MVHRNFSDLCRYSAMSDLAELITESFEKLMSDVHVCLPAEIIKYDADTMLCSAQPLIKHKFEKKDKFEKYSVINKVPVVFPRTATALIRLPVTKGDIVMLVFADHELSNWVNSNGASVEYLDKRYHHINDCFAVAGGYPIGKPHVAANPNAMEIIVQPGTKITIGNETDELLAIAHASFSELKTLTDKLSETLTNIATLTVISSAPGSPSSVPVNAALFTATKTQVDAVATAVQSELNKLSNIKV